MQILAQSARQPVKIPGFRHPSQILTYSGVDKDFVYDAEKDAFVCSNEVFNAFWQALEDRYDDKEAHLRELGTPWPYKLTRLTATTSLSKRFFEQDGKKHQDKSICLNMMQGKAERVEVYTLQDLVDLRLSQKHNQALQYSVCAHKVVNIITSRQYIKANGKLEGWRRYFKNEWPILSRTNQFFDYAWRPGVWAIDIDVKMTEAEALESIYKVAPALRYAPHVVFDSTSTYLYIGDKLIEGGGKFRICFLVTNAIYIPQATEALHKRQILAGYDHYEWTRGEKPSISTGSAIDVAMNRISQLDYTGAVCVYPLVQRRPAPRFYNENTEPVNLRYAVPELTTDEERAFCARDEEIRTKMRETAGIPTKTRERRERQKTETKESEKPAVPKKHNPAIIERGKLKSETMVLVEGVWVRWWDIMKNKEKYDNARCLDPFYSENLETGRQIQPGFVHTLENPGIYSFHDAGTFYPSPKVLRTPDDVAAARAAAAKARGGMSKGGILPRLPKPWTRKKEEKDEEK